MEKTTHRFRKGTSVQRLIVSIWSFMKGNAELKKVETKHIDMDSIYLDNRHKNYLKMLSAYNPALFCINDTEKSSKNDRIRVKEFLESYFPEKSKFEK